MPELFEFLLSGLRSGIRGRSFQVVFVLGMLTIAAAYLSGSFSPRQPRTVALDIGLSGLRFSLVLLNLLWVQELVAREIDRKTIFFSLAYPISRGSFLVGRFGAVLLLSGVAALVLGLLLTVAVVLSGGSYEQDISPDLGLPLWLTIMGLAFDAALVAAFALCVATISTVSILPLALGAAFAVGGKSLGPALEYLASGADGNEQLVHRFGPLLDTIRWLLPDLSRLDWRDWPLYQNPLAMETLIWNILMAACYAGLVLLLAIWLFRRREFS